MKLSPLKLAVLVAALGTTGLQATPRVTIDTVFVGNAGNAATNSSNTSFCGGSYGAVGYDYAIGTNLGTNQQYTTFLNAVDPTGVISFSLWNSKKCRRWIATSRRVGKTRAAKPRHLTLLDRHPSPQQFS